MRNVPFALSLLLAVAPFAVADDLPKGAFDRVGGGNFHHPDRPLAFDFSPDGKHLASGGADGAVRIWDAGKHTLLHTLSVKDGLATRVRYSGDGKSLFVHFGDEKVRRYEADAHYKLLGTTAARHMDKLSVSTDGSLVAGVDIADKARVLDVKTGLDKLELPDARTVCLTPDGSAIAAVSVENVLTVYAVPGGKPLHTIRPPTGEEKAMLSELAFSPDGKRVAVAPEWIAGTVRVYELGKAEPLAEFAGEGPVRFIGKNVVVARNRGRVILYDLTAKTVSGEFADRVGAYAVSADGKTVVTDNASGVGSARIRLWEVTSGREIQMKAADDLGGLLGTTNGANGSAWLFTTDRVFAWKAGGKPVETVHLPRPVTGFTATADALFVASADGLRKIDARKPTDVTLLPDSPKEVISLASSADGSVLAGLDSVQRMVMCNGNGKNLRVWKLPAVPLGVAVAPDGKTVAQIGRDGYVRVWDSTVEAAKPAEKWKSKLARSPNAAITYTPDSKAVVAASLLKVVVFDVEAGTQRAIHERTWDDGPFVSVAVSPDNRLVAAGTLGTNSVVVWERSSGAVVKRFTGAPAPLWQLTFANTRTLLTSGGDGAAVAWDLSNRRGKPAPTADDLKAAWESLGRGPEAFWQAGWVFADADDPWAAFTDGIKAARVVFGDIEKNAALLGDPDFTTREKATKALLAAGTAALPAVKAVAEKSDVAEAKQRAEDLVARLTALAEDPKKAAPTDELNRLSGAVRMAEQLGGPKAVAALDELAAFGGGVGKAAGEAKARLKK